jgi:ketosteroid isomerase-like protein
VSENAEVAETALRRWSEGDLEGTLATLHEDVEWHIAFEIPDLPTGKTVYVGHDEVQQVWDAFRSVWETITLEIEEVLHDEGDQFVYRARFHGKGGASGIEIDRIIYYVLEIEDGKLRRTRPFETREEAFEAAGIEP